MIFGELLAEVMVFSRYFRFKKENNNAYCFKFFNRNFTFFYIIFIQFFFGFSHGFVLRFERKYLSRFGAYWKDRERRDQYSKECVWIKIKYDKQYINFSQILLRLIMTCHNKRNYLETLRKNNEIVYFHQMYLYSILRHQNWHNIHNLFWWYNSWSVNGKNTFSLSIDRRCQTV